MQVQHVPKHVPTQSLQKAFCGLGDVKGIFARFQASHGFVVLAFYDNRDATRALKHIEGSVFPLLGDSRLTAAFVRPAQVEKASSLCLPADTAWPLMRYNSLAASQTSFPTSMGRSG